MREGLVRISVYGGGKEGFLGLLMPEDGKLRMEKTLSRAAMRGFPEEIEFAGLAGLPQGGAGQIEMAPVEEPAEKEAIQTTEQIAEEAAEEEPQAACETPPMPEKQPECRKQKEDAEIETTPSLSERGAPPGQDKGRAEEKDRREDCGQQPAEPEKEESRPLSKAKEPFETETLPEPEKETGAEAEMEPETEKKTEVETENLQTEAAEDALDWYFSPDGALVCFDGTGTRIALPLGDARIPKDTPGERREIDGTVYLVFRTKNGRIVP